MCLVIYDTSYSILRLQNIRDDYTTCAESFMVDFSHSTTLCCKNIVLRDNHIGIVGPFIGAINPDISFSSRDAQQR